jgi:glycerophosphoryl diester phosphodiesterase
MLVAVAARYPFLDAAGPIAFAHRGASPDGLENTLAAVERVVGLGFGYLETDVRATRDGVAVLLHDAALDRTTDRTGAVRELLWAQVERARVGGREPVPRLDDLLGSYPALRVNLDVKTPAAVGPLAEAVRRTGAVDRVCVGSFYDRLVTATRDRLGPRLCTSLGPRGVLRLRLDSLRATGAAVAPGAPATTAAAPGAACAQVPIRLGPLLPVIDRRFVAAAHRRGLVVHAWTVNDRAEMGRLLDLGVDGIMSDDAPGLRAVLAARGLWPGGRAA